jgi:hypothetical protein
MSNKTISINPSLFSLSSSKTKTKKNKEKKETAVKPLINPNILKNKLLKRIKEHKQRETQSIDKKPNQQVIETPIRNNESNYTDEFNESINYLQTLSKQKKVNDEKTIYEKQKQRKRELLEKKTIKNREINVSQQQHVNIDLPEELQLSVNTENKVETNPITLNKYKLDNVPYGILKGGIKPTYRNWTMTQRNNIVTNPNFALTIENGSISKEKIERETRLHNLREKLKNKNINKEVIPEQIPQKQVITEEKPEVIQENRQEVIVQDVVSIPTNNTIPIDVSNEENIATKKITKKTIKRKYTLGKSRIKKAVGVLIKDRRTRKQIINAQKDLKKKSINDIKSYLRDHNLIKIGSNAPNDVIRKLYESSMLSGEITNSNSEILLHNFSKEDKEF